MKQRINPKLQSHHTQTSLLKMKTSVDVVQKLVGHGTSMFITHFSYFLTVCCHDKPDTSIYSKSCQCVSAHWQADFVVAWRLIHVKMILGGFSHFCNISKKVIVVICSKRVVSLVRPMTAW